MIASKSGLSSRAPCMSINTAENDVARVQPLDESDPCWQRLGKKSDTDKITKNRSRRLTFMLILFLFCYMYVGDAGKKHSKQSVYHNMKTWKTRIAPSYSTNGSLTKKLREKRSVTGKETAHVYPATHIEEGMNGIDHSQCLLEVDNTSINRFYKLYSWNEKTMVYFRLNFSSVINVTVEPQVYLPFRWVWVTYGLDHSTRAMLEYPTDFNILSLGLLYMHVYREPEGSKDEFVVSIDAKNSCELQLGASPTMTNIQYALRGLLPKSKFSKSVIRKSLFCYENVINRTSRSQLWWYTTHMLTIAKDYTYYTCCSEKGTCDWNVPQTYYMWLLHAWSLAIACFSPLLMHIVPDHKRRRITNDRWAIFETDSGEGCSSLIDVAREPPDFRQEKWIYLGENPTSIIPLVKKILCLHRSNRFFRRMWRIVLLLLSLSVLFIKVVVYYFKVREDVVEALRLNIPVGELCIPYGYQECLKTTEYFLGGPIVYIPLYVIIASILLCIPESIPNLFLSTKEFQNDANAPVITFLYITDGVLETRGIIRRQVITSGYACLAGKIKERFFMILSFTFWRSFFAMWSRRFKMANLASVAYLRLGHPSSSRALVVGAALLPTILAWILLTGLCILEFITLLLYYGLPVVFFLKLAISGLMTLVLNAVSLRADQENSSRLPYPSLVLGGIIGAVVLVATMFVTTVAIMNFVHTFMFLVNILSFTFAGLVVYPEYSATYSIAAIAILYYLFKSVSSFTEGYIRLLQKVVHVSDRLQRSTWRPYGYHAEEDEYRPCFVRKRKDIFVLGVPRACFDYVARMVKPLRVQVSIAFLKLLITANVIYSTVMLTQAFRHGANINLTTRTMAVIFVGLMPEVFGVFTSKVRRIVDEELYERKIETWVKAYWQEHLKLTSYEAVP